VEEVGNLLAIARRDIDDARKQAIAKPETRIKSRIHGRTVAMNWLSACCGITNLQFRTVALIDRKDKPKAGHTQNRPRRLSVLACPDGPFYRSC